jgi:SAM-dependent methyltransferase
VVELLNRQKLGEFYCVDSWKGETTIAYDQAIVQDLQNIFRKNVDPVIDHIRMLNMMSWDAAAQFEDESVDIVITGQMFEHCEFFWLTIQDMARIIRPGGYVLASTPTAGPVHRYPVDCWRFYPDAYAALSKWAKLELVDSWQDTAAKWYDQVGMMKKPNDINSNT